MTDFFQAFFRPGGVRVLLVVTLIVTIAKGQLFTNHRGPWNIVFKLPHNAKPSGYSSIIALWKASGHMNGEDVDAMTDFSTSSKIYKSKWLDDWEKRSFSAVRLSAYKNSKEVAFITFNSMGKGKNEWLDCSNIIDSSYTDVTSQSKNYCLMEYADNQKRNFFVSHSYGGCPSDNGWFMMKDYDALSGCTEWDQVTGKPYFLYSGDTTMVNWASGNKQTADCLVVSVMAWDMVFKAVQGVVPPQGGIRQLWKSSDTLNSDNPSAQTLTRSPGLVYKSANVEKWQSIPGFFIESVKYAFFTNGKEVAYIIFDGRDTDKNGWYNDNRILYSRWTDIIGYTKVGSSIDGDNTRRFCVWKEHGGCPNDKAWMAILDSSDSGQPCSWDKNVQSRPYFLYSKKSTWALCESGGSWNSAEFPTAETAAIFIKGWRMVMKVAHQQSLSPSSTVYGLWTGTYTVNEFDANALTIGAGTKTYKSSVVDNWSNYHISAVRVSFYKNGKETAYTVFDAHGVKDKNSWFDCTRILYTAYDDLNRLKAVSYCGIPGDGSLNRRFFIQNNYGGCNNDAGWFLVVEGNACTWEQRTTRPYFIYSGKSGRDLQNDFVIADVFLISVVMDNCFPNPCKNGGTCYEEGMDYTCTCSGNWFGQRCTDLNGVWANWGSWGSCSQTCGPGTQTRSRTCTNPAPQGSGSSCAGSSTSSQSCQDMVCIPDIDGQWGQWSSYSACPVTCGNGDRVRTRNCDSPAQSGKGADCPGPSSQVLVCSLSPCAVDGKWAAWGSWSSCTKSCSGGKEVRSRTCTNPATNYGGKDCVGEPSEERSCNTHGCSVCSQGEYLCDDGTCRMGSRCNGINDCDDGSDEGSCSASVLRMSQGYVNNDLTRPGNSEEEESAAVYNRGSLVLIAALLSAVLALHVW
ncbi:uncharacterized protein LOC125650831 [Ostrea edulis]|uniref:uncharacterized protein LOC125650831 n=1 Tax=Ostrea edulis TaxID=37623 RepID=UPI0024AEF81C|nr:uncharacterized protein LOC125650831 [Ostrea edulis]